MAAQISYDNAAAVAFEGLQIGQNNEFRAMRNGEASAEMAFGHAVIFEGSTDDADALNPDAVTDVVAGLLTHTHNYDVAQLGSTGVEAGNMLNVMVRGEIWAICVDGCSPGDRLYVDFTTTEGALRASPELNECIDATKQGQWLTTATAGNLAKLKHIDDKFLLDFWIHSSTL